MSFAAGENVGPYQFIEKLGQGGMATVYKAYHAGLDRYVALKVLHPDLTEDLSFTARFQREARLIAKLEHPNIVPVHDFAEHNGYPYLVMKFIEGETLKARLQRGPLTSEEIKGIVDAVGTALAYAHQQGILHRDIKPSNVLTAADGHIYLADFGLARIAQRGASTLSTDSVLGTPQYISPEQAIGNTDLDEGTDIYSFGVMLYEMVVGKVPFSADTPFSIIYDHIYSPLPLPRTVNPSVPESVERVLLKALAKERKDRHTSVNELVEAFISAWESAGVPMQGTAVLLPKQPIPGSSPAPKKAGIPHKAETAKGASEAVMAKKGTRRKALPWMFIGGGVVLAVCCFFAGLLSLPGVLNWLRPSTQEPAPTEIVSTEFDYCTGEQTWLAREYFPEQEIQNCLGLDHYITDIAFQEGEWIIAMTKTAGYTDQVYLAEPEFPETAIREYWDQGYDITGVIFADGKWIVVMSANTGFTNQAYFGDTSFPVADVQSYWDQGYAITSLGYGDGSWVVVMSEGSELEEQAYLFEEAFPEEKIRPYWDADYYITSVANGNEKLVVVMSQTDQFSNQFYYHEESFPEEGIKEDWAENFFITNLTYGNSVWVVVMSKP
jgi:serine/threonine-protein kinase